MYAVQSIKKTKNCQWNCVFISPFHFIMDADPKNWTRSCEAAKQLRKDLAEGIIDPRNYKPALVQKSETFIWPFQSLDFLPTCEIL